MSRTVALGNWRDGLEALNYGFHSDRLPGTEATISDATAGGTSTAALLALTSTLEPAEQTASGPGCGSRDGRAAWRLRRISCIAVFFCLASPWVIHEHAYALTLCARYDTNADRVWTALVEVLIERGEMIQRLDKDAGVIETQARVINVGPNDDVALLRDAADQWGEGRRYRLHLVVSSAGRADTRVNVSLSLMGWRMLQGPHGTDEPAPMRPANWMPMQSNGSLERQVLTAVGQRTGSPWRWCAAG